MLNKNGIWSTAFKIIALKIANFKFLIIYCLNLLNLLSLLSSFYSDDPENQTADLCKSVLYLIYSKFQYDVDWFG